MKASVLNMFALTFPTSSQIHCIFMINSLVNIYQEHFYIRGHVFQFSCCIGERCGGVTHCSPDKHQLWRWPQRYHGFSGLGPGTCWEDLDGNFTHRLQGQSQHSPPGVVTFCQSLRCACIDAKSQAGMKVLLSGPQSRIPILARNPVCSSWKWALFHGMSDWSEDPFVSLLWWQTCRKGIWDCPGHPIAALASCAGQELQGLGQPKSPI